MKSRTDFVSIGWMDQLRQAMYNQIKAMGVLKCSPKVGQKLCGKAILNSVLDRT